MKKRTLCLTLAFNLFLLSLFSQSKVNAEDELLASAWAKKYPDKDVAYTNAEQYVTFDLEKKDLLVTAKVKTNNTFIALKPNTSFGHSIFFDDKSEVGKIKGKYITKGDYFTIYSVVGAYQDEGIFLNDQKVATFSIPLSYKGDKYSYTYEEDKKDIRFYCREFFQESYPVIERTITFEIPEWLDIDFKEYNFTGFDIKKEITTGKLNSRIVKYTAKNLPGWSKQDHRNAPPLAYTFPHIVIVPKKATTKRVNFQMFEKTEDLYGYYKEICKGIGNDNEILKPVVSNLLQNKKTDEEKIKTIFYWVQDHIRYIAFENGIMGFRPESAQSVYKNLYGDCKGMANLTAEMLKIAGYDARLTWIGTRGIPYDYSLPSLIVDNHMICTVFLKGEKIFLDGTEDYIGYKDYAQRIQGRQVMIQNGETFELAKIPEFGFERNVESEKSTIAINGDAMNIETQMIYDGEAKTHLLSGISTLKSSNKKEVLENYVKGGNKNVQLVSLNTTDTEDRDNTLKMDYKSTVVNQITKLEDEIYVDMLLDHDFEDFTIDSTRFSPYDFHYKLNRNAQVTLNVPKGYMVNGYPKNLEITNEDFNLKMSYELTGDKLLYKKSIILPNAMIRRQNFKAWNKAVKQLKEFYRESITLKKS